MCHILKKNVTINYYFQTKDKHIAEKMRFVHCALKITLFVTCGQKIVPAVFAQFMNRYKSMHHIFYFTV